MRILIADRHPEEKGSSESILRHAGHVTAVVRDARALLVAARGGPFEVFVMRLQSPPTEDLLAYQSLRSDRELSQVPVIFCIEPETDPADAAAALAAGADHVLVEPLERERLLAAVESPLRSRSFSDSSTWSRRAPAASDRSSVRVRGDSPDRRIFERECSELVTELLNVVETLRNEISTAASQDARKRLDELVGRAHRTANRLARQASAPEFDFHAEA